MLQEWLTAVSGIVCHRRPDRMLWEAAFLCARCSGLYLGVLAVTVFQLLSASGCGSRLPPRKLLLVAPLLVLPLAFDGLAAGRLYAGANWLRWSTGVLAGAGIGMLLLPLVNGLRSSPPASPVLLDARSFSYLVVLPAAALTVLGLTAAPPVVQAVLTWSSLLGLALLYLSLNLVALGTLSELRGSACRGWYRRAGLAAAALLLVVLELYLIYLLKAG